MHPGSLCSALDSLTLGRIPENASCGSHAPEDTMHMTMQHPEHHLVDLVIATFRGLSLPVPSSAGSTPLHRPGLCLVAAALAPPARHQRQRGLMNTPQGRAGGVPKATLSRVLFLQVWSAKAPNLAPSHWQWLAPNGRLAISSCHIPRYSGLPRPSGLGVSCFRPKEKILGPIQLGFAEADVKSYPVGGLQARRSREADVSSKGRGPSRVEKPGKGAREPQVESWFRHTTAQKNHES